MAYGNIFTSGKPVISPDTGSQVIDYTRNALHALRDGILYGGMKNFNAEIAVGTGSNQKPQYLYYKNGTIWIRIEITWGNAGGSLDKPTVMVMSYSENSGGVWDTIGTYTIAYTADGYFNTGTWS